MRNLKTWFRAVRPDSGKTRVFDIEASRRCNVKCRFCPRPHIKNVGDMEPDTFRRFLENVPLQSKDIVNFCGLGEPLLNSSLPDYLRLLRERYPRQTIGLTTNGTLLDGNIVPALLDSRINFIQVSFNGIDAADYERQVEGAQFECTLANLEYTRDEIRKRENSPTELQVTYLLARQNLRDKQKIESFWADRTIMAFPLYYHTRGGFMKQPDMTPLDKGGFAKQRSCTVFEGIQFIAWNGDVLSCCHDIEHKYVFGNINQDRLREVVARKKRVVKQNQWPPICFLCTDATRRGSLG